MRHVAPYVGATDSKGRQALLEIFEPLTLAWDSHDVLSGTWVTLDYRNSQGAKALSKQHASCREPLHTWQERRVDVNPALLQNPFAVAHDAKLFSPGIGVLDPDPTIG